MNNKGYEKVCGALVQGNIEGFVEPQPAEGESVRYLTIETGLDVQPSRILNALHEARLMKRDGPMLATETYVPELVLLASMPGSLTFEDVN